MQNRKAQTYDRGLAAEKAAANWLKLKGYKILETRYKTKFGEIDLIISKKDVIAFVEVKARKDKSQALESVTPKMQERITQAAMYYISQNNVCDYDLRFDVVTVSPTFLGFNHIEHLDNAWEASA